MKLTKKLMSMLVALIMVFTLAVPAFAADGNTDNGSITIDDAIVDQEYTIYQILDLESYNATAETYVYKATSDWATFINSAAIKDVYIKVDTQGYVTWIEGADVAAFAKLAQAHAKTLSNNQGSKVADRTTVSFTDLGLGYYLVDTTLGTLCSLDTTNPNVVMEEKNEAPTITKDVQEDSNSAWGETNDADINQVVNFKATVTVQPGAENYIVHDTMSAGLTFAGVENVAIGGLTKGTDYTVTVPQDGCTFHLEFQQIYLDTITAAKDVVITYSATLNENAVVGLPGNPNKVKLQYSDTAEPTFTPEDTTITYTWDMGVLKYGDKDETKVLKDAKFVLLNADRTKVANIEDGKFIGWVTIQQDNKETEEIEATDFSLYELTTGEDGKIEVEGLDADTYYLRETQAPAGYNKIINDIEFTIVGLTEKEGEDGGTKVVYETVITKVNNQSGTELPSTGGMGTTLFYAAGGIMVVGAVVALITKKRMED